MMKIYELWWKYMSFAEKKTALKKIYGLWWKFMSYDEKISLMMLTKRLCLRTVTTLILRIEIWTNSHLFPRTFAQSSFLSFFRCKWWLNECTSKEKYIQTCNKELEINRRKGQPFFDLLVTSPENRELHFKVLKIVENKQKALVWCWLILIKVRCP